MDRYSPQAYESLSKGYKNNYSVNEIQSNGRSLKISSDTFYTNNNRQCLQKTQKGQNIKKLLKSLFVLEEGVEGSSKLRPFQKAQMNNMLSSVQSLIQSLSIQYSDVEMPEHAYQKLTILVESVENLVYSIISNKEEEAKYGIFQDRITNLSPSISSRSIGGNYEDELVERTNNIHINRLYNNEYYDNDLPKESDDEDSEFDDEEISQVDDRFTSVSAERYREPYKEAFGTTGAIRPVGFQIDGSSHPASSFITPTRSTLQYPKGRVEREESVKRNKSGNIYSKFQAPYNRDGRFSNRTNNINLLGGQTLLIPQEAKGTFNRFPARNQVAYDKNHIFS